MDQVTEAILKSKTPRELNKLRILIVKDPPSGEVFEQRQQAFIDRMASLKRTPKDKREGWENPINPSYYNPTIEQYEEVPDWGDRERQINFPEGK